MSFSIHSAKAPQKPCAYEYINEQNLKGLTNQLNSSLIKITAFNNVQQSKLQSSISSLVPII